MSWEWTRTIAPTQEPITLTEARAQARITHTSEDTLLRAYIQTAREYAETYMNRGLMTQTWKLTLPRFGDVMWLPMAAPLQSVTSVQYYDDDGTLQTLATTYYAVDTVSRPGRVVRKPDQSWPSVQWERVDAVIITYVVGWTAVTSIPERIKHGIRQYVTALDADREGLSEYAGQAMRAAEACWSDRIEWMPPQDFK